MTVRETKLKDCFIIEPTVFEDERGYFFESYNQEKFGQLTGLNPLFIQDNQSKSSYGVVRGLHQQTGVFAQAKLIRVLEGCVLDVAVDAREGSETYGQYIAMELSAENNLQIFVPRGFLHGFSVLSEEATVFYKCDNMYHTESEDGVYPLDETLNIDWQIPLDKIILSEKDRKAREWGV